ncbi:glycoside hydrolase family 15 protein [Kribbella jiaozuonensis]|uniref:Trehalase n=1 Tax=Kribbella jiaozuonensis TaxID=2575441 RepID=A0A4U3LUY9_9ACTN|nr:glycoside hydrolase family 15 protein [Kribbella jiaozuonensis]TKK79911.1 glycoside hydrolase family 15 protein [Kribbella jiaozuonensis]
MPRSPQTSSPKSSSGPRPGPGRRIEDYALIGDLQTAALVSKQGSIDWLCFPRFDSPACFAALLGTDDNGHWRMAPRDAEAVSSRHYRGDTLVLETEWSTSTGTVRVIDFMPPRDAAPDVVRIVEGVSGSVEMRSELKLRFDYGHVVPWVRRSDGQIDAIAGPDAVSLRSDVHQYGRDLATYADFRVSENDRAWFVLTWHPSHHPVPEPTDALHSLEPTETFWQEWIGRSHSSTDFGEEVTRSVLTLKALTYAPSGGIVAAPTTSLPETLGGQRNWDYRYCWLRDATMTLSAMLRAGYTDEAEAWRNWLLRAIAGSPADLQIMYGVTGERRLTEFEAVWLPGYAESAPVRIGNAAAEQLQIDVFGEVMDVLALAREHQIGPTDEAWQVQRALMAHLDDVWDQPDEGIWEVRGGRQHFTHSKVMAWVAFDRAARAVQRFGLNGPAKEWRARADEIHRAVCEQAYDADRNTFTQAYGSKALDAAVLLIPQVGFLPADDPRVVGTVEAVQRELTADGFVRRYLTEHTDDGINDSEGTFLICSFWMADALAMIGRVGEARDLYERLVALRNDVGLLAEEYDVASGRMLGNFPQAFSHLGLVNTAWHLTTAESPLRKSAY